MDTNTNTVIRFSPAFAFAVAALMALGAFYLLNANTTPEYDSWTETRTVDGDSWMHLASCVDDDHDLRDIASVLAEQNHAELSDPMYPNTPVDVPDAFDRRNC